MINAPTRWRTPCREVWLHKRTAAPYFPFRKKIHFYTSNEMFEQVGLFIIIRWHIMMISGFGEVVVRQKLRSGVHM